MADRTVIPSAPDPVPIVAGSSSATPETVAAAMADGEVAEAARQVAGGHGGLGPVVPVQPAPELPPLPGDEGVTSGG